MGNINSCHLHLDAVYMWRYYFSAINLLPSCKFNPFNTHPLGLGGIEKECPEAATQRCS